MTLYLVRHGSAGSRNAADPGDCERHLDPKGLGQAETVADELDGEPVARILSSPLPRCVETVEPLAKRLGLEIEITDALREGADPATTWDLLEEMSGTTAVLCSHGDVIPEAITRGQRRGTRVIEPSGFSKGSIWALRDWTGSHFAEASWNSCRSSRPV